MRPCFLILWFGMVWMVAAAEVSTEQGNDTWTYVPTPYPTISPAPTHSKNSSPPTPVPTLERHPTIKPSPAPTKDSVTNSTQPSVLPTPAPTITWKPTPDPTPGTVSPTTLQPTKTSPSPTIAPTTKAPTTPKPSTDAPTTSPTAAPHPDNNNHNKKKRRRPSFWWKMLFKTILWLLAIALALLLFGFFMSNRYRIYYYCRSVYYRILRWRGIQWCLRKLGLSSQQQHRHHEATPNLNDIIFDNDLREGLLLQENN